MLRAGNSGALYASGAPLQSYHGLLDKRGEAVRCSMPLDILAQLRKDMPDAGKPSPETEGQRRLVRQWRR